MHEECGVFGILGHPDASALTALGLHALQQRRRERQGGEVGRRGHARMVAGRAIGSRPTVPVRAGVRAGHMPGAVSLPFAELAPGGRMLPVEQLRARLSEAAGDRSIIASCGSGVTASVLALAAGLVGRSAVVYDGSWSEWGHEASGRPVA